MSSLQTFELFVARRYLLAKRRQAIVSVVTVISVLGVAAGVMALIVALAINNGFRQTLQSLLLGATAHVSIQEKNPDMGITNWRELAPQLSQIPGVTEVSPALYGNVFFSGPMQGTGGILKGTTNPPSNPGDGVVMGFRLARETGMMKDSKITIINPMGEMTPFGPRPSYQSARVADTFETGFYDLDHGFAFTSLDRAQKILGTGDTVNVIELKLANIDQAQQIANEAEKVVGSKLAATTWMEQNRALLSALTTERTVTVITIGLIELIAALNILITLTMMVMEKNRDIAILVSMGATAKQIRRIFVVQGGLIGIVGTILGLILGYTICYFAGTGQWIQLDEQVYPLGYVPFEPRWIDGVWVSAASILISLLATLYPARSASSVAPAEALRYE